MGTSLTFLGAAGTVTGSRHLVEHNNKRVLLDCGLFQGLKAIRQRNWDGLGVPAPSLDAVVLSHAHIDHTGFLPRLHRDGFKGPVYCTSATAELLARAVRVYDGGADDCWTAPLLRIQRGLTAQPT